MVPDPREHWPSDADPPQVDSSVGGGVTVPSSDWLSAVGVGSCFSRNCEEVVDALDVSKCFAV